MAAALLRYGKQAALMAAPQIRGSMPTAFARVSEAVRRPMSSIGASFLFDVSKDSRVSKEFLEKALAVQTFDTRFLSLKKIVDGSIKVELVRNCKTPVEVKFDDVCTKILLTNDERLYENVLSKIPGLTFIIDQNCSSESLFSFLHKVVCLTEGLGSSVQDARNLLASQILYEEGFKDERERFVIDRNICQKALVKLAYHVGNGVLLGEINKDDYVKGVSLNPKVQEEWERLVDVAISKLESIKKV